MANLNNNLYAGLYVGLYAGLYEDCICLELWIKNLTFNQSTLYCHWYKSVIANCCVVSTLTGKRWDCGMPSNEQHPQQPSGSASVFSYPANIHATHVHDVFHHLMVFNTASDSGTNCCVVFTLHMHQCTQYTGAHNSWFSIYHLMQMIIIYHGMSSGKMRYSSVIDKI